MKIILAFKTHFDIGFTKLAKEIVSQYSGQMLSNVIDTCLGTADMGPLHYVWTMPSWPLTIMQQNREKRPQLDQLIKNGQIAFHALPYTLHTDFCGMADMIEGLHYADRLAAEYGITPPISAKMTDVPGHGRALPTLLANAGVQFLHLGCNAFATPPHVPPLFFWQGFDGSRVLTMYSKGGYGSAMIPPEDWPFPVWMALMHTHDNCGPQSAKRIRAMVAQARKACPDAEIVCGTMDDFYRELSQCDLTNVPVIAKDLADSWIHGVGSYPAEVRTVRQARRDIVTAAAALFAAGGDTQRFSQAHRQTYDALSLFGEHTWGLDVKTWMNSERVYEKKAFRAAKDSEEYRRIEASWQEQRERAQAAECGAHAALSCPSHGSGALFNPNGTAFSGWVDVNHFPGAVQIGGRSMVYAREIPPLGTAAPESRSAPAAKSALENHRYRLTLDKERGVITELYDKVLDRALARERDGVGVFSYQYDVYGIGEMTEYLRAYAYRFFDWGIRDNGKDNYPEVPHQRFFPQLSKYTQNGCTLTLHYTSSASGRYGDAARIRVLISLPPEGDELFVRIEMDAKEETPFVESGSLCLPMAAEAPRFLFNKNGDLIDPSKDIAAGAGHALYCLESFACAESGHAGICIISRDAPLCAIGETGIYSFRQSYEAHSPILCFNLFNNMWGTNFPQWIGGDLCWDFTLFGYSGCCDGRIMTRALALDRGARYLPIDPVTPELHLPEHMQLLSLKPLENGWQLILRDTGLQPRKAVLHAPRREITPTNLQGHAVGARVWERCSFSAAAMGIYAFTLSQRNISI
ncbi:glycoside hydrolase family 38 N-terminal domain-containing protein [Dysosmobacter sp.]